MSDIQPTEAEREDVRRLLIAWGKPDGLLKEITSIKADVVKAERERCIRRIRFEMLDDRYIHTLNRLEQAIFSDDQEARNG